MAVGNGRNANAVNGQAVNHQFELGNAGRSEPISAAQANSAVALQSTHPTACHRRRARESGSFGIGGLQTTLRQSTTVMRFNRSRSANTPERMLAPIGAVHVPSGANSSVDVPSRS